MGFIGKMLVVLHGAVSIAVLTWAVGVYTHRINWNTPPVKDGKDRGPGLYDRQKAAAEQYNVAVEKSYNRWSGNLNQVVTLEAERYPRRAFYNGQLALVKSGSLGGMAVPQPVQELVQAPNGYLDIRNPTGRKAFEVRPGVPSDSVAGYERKMAKLVEDIKASQDRNAQSIVDREKLNKEIVGVTQPAVVKGLRQRLLEQKVIQDKATNEERYVVHFVTNHEAEFGLLKKRRDAMNGRTDELLKFYEKNPSEVPAGLDLKLFKR